MVADTPDVFIRMNKMVDYIIRTMPNDMKGANIVKRVAREMITDMTEIPSAIAEFYIKQLASLMYYVATGDGMDDIPLPEDFIKAE